MTSNSQINANISDSTVIEHTRNEIDRAPKMKQQVAAKVARNLDEVLIELKTCGVPMHTICREVPLGDPDDRDSKALFKYRNPEGSKPRKYVTKSERYFDITQAISRIPGHPLTGFSGELLRRVFEGTPYAPARSSSESVAIRLKTILDKSVEKIAQHIDLRNTYQQLARIRHGTQEYLQVEDQYLAATQEKKYTLCIPELELGFVYDVLSDDKGNYLELKSDGDGTYWLAVRRQVSLFIGLDDDSEPQPYLILHTTGGFYATQGHVSVYLDRYQDAPRVPGIMFYGGDEQYGEEVQRFLLDEDIFMRSVSDPWSRYDHSSESAFSLAAAEWEKLYPDSQPLEQVSVGRDEFTVDKRVEPHRRHANNQQLTEMFFSSNPKFHSKYIEGKELINFKPTSVDMLERFGKNVDGFGSLKLGGNKGTLNLPSSTPLIFGDGALGKLMGWFTGSANLSLELDSSLRKLLGDDLENSDFTPPYGWYIASLDPSRWSAIDLLWLRTKIFTTKIDSLFQATRPQEELFDLFERWLEVDE